MLLLLVVACGGELIYRPTKDTDSTPIPVAFSLTSLQPESGPATGGTLLTVRGSGFDDTLSATVGGAPCASLTRLSDEELQCVTPPASPGDASFIAVQGDASASLLFTYLPTDTGDSGDPGHSGDSAPPAPTIDRCELEGPLSLSLAPGDASTIYGRVYVAGRTDAYEIGAGITGELGVGSGDPSTWTWSAMGYAGSDGTDDRYQGTLTANEEGSFFYSVRFALDGGEPVLCTTSDGSYGSLTVAEVIETIPVDYCHLQYPCDMTLVSGSASDVVYGWVYQAGVTDGVGEGIGMTVEVGVGPDGSDPATDTSWSWASMSYNVDTDGLSPDANDEYAGSFVAPSTAGDYDFCLRVSADGGASWTYCDAGGVSCGGLGSSDGYLPAEAGQLVVQ